MNMKYISTFEKFGYQDDDFDIVLNITKSTKTQKGEWVIVNKALKEKFLALNKDEIEELSVTNSSHNFTVTKTKTHFVFVTKEGLEFKMKIKDLITKLT